MVKPAIALCLLAACLPNAGCRNSLDEEDVRAFIDQADEAARKRYAPGICALRGEGFSLALTFQAIGDSPPSEMTIDRKLFCHMAGSFSKYRQYRLERRSLEIDVAGDGRTANVVAEYVETLPYYPEYATPATPDDFHHFVVVESHDESVVGIEDGDLVFKSARVAATQAELIDKSRLNLPYD